MNSSEHWFAGVVGGRSEGDVARAVGLVQSTLSRQLRGDALSPENVVAIARQFGVSPVQGLIDIGLITLQEVRDLIGVASVAVVSDEVLVREVLTRIKEGSHAALTEPVLEVHTDPGETLSAE